MNFIREDLEVLSKNTLIEMVLLLQQRSEETVEPVQPVASQIRWWEQAESWGIVFNSATDEELSSLLSMGTQAHQVKALRKWTGCTISAAKKYLAFLKNGVLT